MTTPPEDPVLFSFFNEIGIINQLSVAAFEEVLPDGLKISQFSVLNHLVRQDEAQSPSHLANAFQVTKGAMTNTLGRLETRGLVKIRPDPTDRRGKRVAVTARGRKVRDQSIAALAPLLAAITQAIPEERFTAAIPFLQEVRKFLDAARD